MDEADNRISLQKLEVFCRVVALGGVGRAAEELFVSQPVVSAHLRSLEERLGVALFIRDGRRIRLTEAGAAAHRWASEVLRGRSDLARTLGDLSQGVSGRARVGAGMSVGNYLLPGPLVEFQREHPGAKISVLHSSVESALEGVEGGDLDFALVASYQTLDASVFEATLVGRPRYALVAAAEAQIPDRLDVETLANLPFVSPPSGLRIRSSQDFALSTLGVADRHVVIELGSAEAIKTAVIEGLGVSLLWRVSVEAELAAGTLREVTVDGARIHDNLFVVSQRGALLTPLQERLRSFLSERIGERLRPQLSS